jgi:hypothetical protein
MESSDNLVLQVGTTYRNRQGGDIEIVMRDPSTNSFIGDDGRYYFPTGQSIQQVPGDVLDLVSVVPASDLIIDVGGVYLNATGEKIEIVDQTVVPSSKLVLFIDQNGNKYLQDGRGVPETPRQMMYKLPLPLLMVVTSPPLLLDVVVDDPIDFVPPKQSWWDKVKNWFDFHVLGIV